MTSDVLVQTLTHVWNVLNQAGASAAVMGGLAVSAWGYLRATRDVDLLVGVNENEWRNLWTKLCAEGFRQRGPFLLRQLGRFHIAETNCEAPHALWGVKVDFVLAESPLQLQAIARAVTLQFPGSDRAFRVLTCEDLILHKIEAGRIIDEADCVQLIKINRATLDFAYLEAAARQHGLDRQLASVAERAGNEGV